MTTWPLATSFVVLLLLGHHRTVRGADAAVAMFAARQGTAPSPSRAESAPQPPASASAPPPSPKPSCGLLVPTLGTHKALLIVGLTLLTSAALELAALSTKVSVHA